MQHLNPEFIFFQKNPQRAIKYQYTTFGSGSPQVTKEGVLRKYHCTRTLISYFFKSLCCWLVLKA